MPSPAANRRLKVLLAQLVDVKSVSKMLQSDGLNLLDARDLVDGLLEIQLSFANYLGTCVQLNASHLCGVLFCCSAKG
jgi:hypothetical protein